VSKSVFFVELLLFHGLLLAFLFWELRKTSALQKKTAAEAAAREAAMRKAEDAADGEPS
jgi:F0F1-type ATP synthase gamma subunit